MVVRKRTWFIGAAVVVVALGVGSLLLTSTTKVVSVGGITFHVPWSWMVRTGLPATSGPGQTLALVGTLPWGPCETSDINCHFSERLSRHEIEVEVGVGLMLVTDFCDYAAARPDLEPRKDGVRVTATHYVRIDGRPAITTEYSLDTPDYYGSDGWRTWELAPSDTTQVLYRIFAKWRGPGDEEFLSALDRLVDSIDLGPSGYATTPIGDCGEPFPAAPAT